MKKTNEILITKANVAIYNGLENAEIAKRMAPFKYTPERIHQGQLFSENAQRLIQKREMEKGEQKAATRLLNEKFVDANLVYMQHVKVGRIALKNKVGDWDKLQINGERKESLSGWVMQARLFYANLLNNEDLVNQMAKFGISKKLLKEGQQLVEEVEKAYANQQKEMGEAQDDTKERDAAIDTLNDWYNDYIGIARIALADKPQLLEIMGIVEPS